MRIHVIKHVPFEGPGRIADWASARGHTITESLALTCEYPDPADTGLVCVMGGPMDADDHGASPWLTEEKAWLRAFIDGGGRALGVCLGAQILAELIGGRVERNPEREIGWFEIEMTESGRRSGVFAQWPERAVVGHWHGDTFALPPSVSSVASSLATANQAFEYDGRVVGLQFHLEWSASGLRALVDACGGELSGGGRFVQSAEEMLIDADEHSEICESMLWSLLDAVAREAPGAEPASTQHARGATKTHRVGS
ncbi:MAG: type 1 glutamine amidotransferase [Coriobacteriales bacterium]|nr:type 1 glutamine amidotransferase [Coriobacteriales bacterium]